MFLAIVATLLAPLALVQQTDTTVAIQRGQRLAVSAHSGSITVKTWTRNAVRIVANTEGRARIDVSTSGSTVSVEANSRRGGPPEVEFEITAPAWAPVTLNGVNTDMTIRGIRAPIDVETVQGAVDVDGGEGSVSLRSVQGEVKLRNARGSIDVASVNESVSVTDAAGDVQAETVNGDVSLARVQATSVGVTTVNGDVDYDGPVSGNGRYQFSTHNGDITLTIAGAPSAQVEVSTFSGDFDSDFPVTLTGARRGKRFNFTLGGGSARLSLESFQGTIALRKR